MQDHHLQSLEYLAFVQTSFGPLDLVSSQKKIGNWHGPQHIRQLKYFYQREWMVDKSVESRLSITPAYFIQVIITTQGSIATVLVEITTLE
jgi:hypothetical protein